MSSLSMLYTPSQFHCPAGQFGLPTTVLPKPVVATVNSKAFGLHVGLEPFVDERTTGNDPDSIRAADRGREFVFSLELSGD
jgi:hypothetical protein